MKNKKLVIIISVAILIVLAITGLVVFNSIKNKEETNGNYMTKGEYYLYFIKEVNMYLNDYEEEDYESDKGEEIAAHTMYEHYLIEKGQTKKLNKPVTREIVAQSLVRYMEFRTEHNIKISDINNCVDEQAIIDAVGMEIFKLENGKFKPKNYMTKEEVVKAIEKMLYIELNSHYPENGWEDESDDEKDTDNSEFVSQLTLSSGKKIDLNIPYGFKNTTNNDTYKVFEKEGVTIYIEALSDSNIDEYLITTSVEEENRCFLTNSKNCSTSERKNINVNGKNYYYQDIYSEYQGFIITKWYDKKIWIDLDDTKTNYFTIRISSENSAIDDSLVENLLNIY